MQVQCFRASLSVPNTDNLFHSPALVYAFAFHSPAHEFRVFVVSLLSFDAPTTNDRRGATAKRAERPLLLC